MKGLRMPQRSTPAERADHDLTTAKALAQAWTTTDAEASWGGLTHCIEATKVAIAVLGRFHVAARPLPCGIVVANARAAELVDAGVPYTDWPLEAWSIGVDPDTDNANPVLDAKMRDARVGGWNGHLIVAGQGWMADYAAAQFSRRHLRMEAWAAPKEPLAPGDKGWRLVNGAGHRIDVFPRPELARWRNGSAWRQEPPRWLVEQLVVATRAELNKAGAR